MQPFNKLPSKSGKERGLRRATRPQEKRPDPKVAAEAVKLADRPPSARALELPPDAKLNPRDEPMPSTWVEKAPASKPAKETSDSLAKNEGEALARRFAASGVLPRAELEATPEAEPFFAKAVQRLVNADQLGLAAMATFNWMKSEIGEAASKYAFDQKEPTVVLHTWRAKAGNALVDRMWVMALNDLRAPPREKSDSDQ